MSISWVSLYTDSKLADMWTFGIEGEDYSYDENGQVVQNLISTTTPCGNLHQLQS